MNPEEALKLFRSLDFYYDHNNCHQISPACGDLGGVLLRWLYGGLLPCTATQQHGGNSDGGCLSKHASFSPPWAAKLQDASWIEVEHRAYGLGIPDYALPDYGRRTPTGASDFMDAGVAGMWYLIRRGSGIFYHVGKSAVAPGKNEMAARLLRELANQKDARSDRAWKRFADERKLFKTRLQANHALTKWLALNGSQGALADARRIVAAGNGSSTCEQQWIRHCRCRYVLNDRWDAALVWLARSLRYDTLIFTATLLTNGPCQHAIASNLSQPKLVDDEAPRFVTAYPELVDVRPLAPWDDSQEDTVGLTLDPRQVGNHGTWTLRKQPRIAEEWIESMRRTNRLSLRNPFAVFDETQARPCNFSTASRSLGCASHLSDAWQRSAYKRCGLVMCGQWGRPLSVQTSAIDAGASSKEHLTVEEVRSYLVRVYPSSTGLRSAAPAVLLALFDSLHHYYRLPSLTAPLHAIEWRKNVLAARAHPPRLPIDRDPSSNCFRAFNGLGVMRNRFAGLLPCNAGISSCLAKQAIFQPTWLEEVRTSAFLEVQHVAYGDKRAPRLVETVMTWQDFVDPGPVGMWYHYVKGSGVFLEVGRMLVAPSKNEAIATLLGAYETWPPRGFFPRDICKALAGGQLCSTAQQLAQAIRATGNGSVSCEQVGITQCRDSYALGDAWDRVMLRMARFAGYDTLFLYAPLVSLPTRKGVQPSLCGVSEIVDLRVPEELADGGRDHVSLDEWIAPKSEFVAKAWGQSARLTLRDPIRLHDARSARTCHFGPAATLACEGHVSSDVNVIVSASRAKTRIPMN